MFSFFSSRRRHTRFSRDWSSDVCSSDLGYGAVQVSPPQEHVVLAGRPWWQDYQPVSYTLTTRRGDRAGFAAMVSACHAAGVKVYADAVINHMAGGGSTGPGSGGSSFSQYDYPGIYQWHDFHHCGRNGDD